VGDADGDESAVVMAGLLEGIRVVDLSVWRPGPYATQLLAGFGADVVKVEPPGGDPMRAFPELFATLNAAKQSMRLDLKARADRETFLDMAAEADVVVEGFRPGVVDRLGVGYTAVRARNPGVVYCSVSGFGQSGPLVDAPGHDLNYLAWAGALSPDGEAPSVPRIPVADLAAGLAAATAVCAACVRRLRSGEGAYLDVAMIDVLASWTGAAAPRLEGNDAATRAIAGYGTFPTSDGGYVTLGVLAEAPFWAALCRELGLDEHAGLSFGERAEQTAALQPVVAAAVATRRRDELVQALLAAGVPVAPVLDRPGVLASPHLRARGTVTESEASVNVVWDPVRPPAAP
jgi:crotonobetainyl-CoA:carnitine CoA-transferase CaiB-like acyl-CoA transferase